MKTLIIKIIQPKGRITTTYHLDKGDLVVLEREMRDFAKTMNVTVRRVVSQYVGMVGYELNGARTKIAKVAKHSIRWAK